MQPVLSIVMAYFDRQPLLLRTLQTIAKSNYNDYEIIIINDGGPLIDLKEITQDLNIKIINISKGNKTWVNSCIPYNIGFKEAQGDIIIIQNPECLHIGDILTHVYNNLTDQNYLSFACFSLNKNNTLNYENIDLNQVIQQNNQAVKFDGANGWYNHPQHRPVNYHFCTAITRKNLNELGGFDERFADGMAYEDNELLFRIKKKRLNIISFIHPFVVHQWHYTPKNIQNANTLIEKNRKLYNQIINEKTI